MIRLSLLLMLCACTHKVQLKEELQAKTETSRESAKEQHSETVKAETETIIKKTGPVETNEITELFGWAPPPPDAPKGTPAQWKPVKRVELNVKTAGSTTEKQIDKQAKTDSESTSKDKGKTTGEIKAAKIGTTETSIGLSWQIKLLIAVVAVVMLVAVVSFINPNLLGLPVKVLGWIIGKIAPRSNGTPSEPKL